MAGPSKNRGKTARGRFAKGNAFGKGRPEGSRNKASIAVEVLLEGEAEALTRKAIEKALGGDTTALRLCLERLCSPRKDRPIALSMPRIAKPQDAVKCVSAVMDAVAGGEITPSEGQALAHMIEVHRRTVEAEDLERRLSALEKRLDAGGLAGRYRR
jgi:hypothetical protein